MKLIPTFTESLHEIKLPSPEKSFTIEKGNEKQIGKWITNGAITCELEKLFEWMNVE
ncbi:hypothetical protein [Prochlorococcus marinus]|uniref:hypothetical protein n=1 Tax=Prochlorococcus marinus TaxID=1219 RepID=UPI0022B45BDD|nr:hypothetical protein [Prochlorococcus marinus]